MDKFLEAVIEEAQKGLDEGGIPIGSVLVIDGQIVGRGHNRRVQKGSAILHAEMDCLENAGLSLGSMVMMCIFFLVKSLLCIILIV